MPSTIRISAVYLEIQQCIWTQVRSGRSYSGNDIRRRADHPCHCVGSITSAWVRGRQGAPLEGTRNFSSLLKPAEGWNAGLRARLPRYRVSSAGCAQALARFVSPAWNLMGLFSKPHGLAQKPSLDLLRLFACPQLAHRSSYLASGRGLQR